MILLHPEEKKLELQGFEGMTANHLFTRSVMEIIMEPDCISQKQSGMIFNEKRIPEKRNQKSKKNNSGYLALTIYLFDYPVFKDRFRKNRGFFPFYMNPYTIYFITYFAVMLSNLTFGFVKYQIVETDREN